MSEVHKILRVKQEPTRVFTNPSRQSMEAVEDYSIKKVMNLQEGTIETTPLNYNDITNKAYVDSVAGGVSQSEFDALVGTVAVNTAFTETPSSVITAGTNLTWSGNTLNAVVGTASATVSWGNITGTVSDQADLQSELDGFDSHVASTAIHFTEDSISHTNIQDIGSNTHAQIDTHIGSSSIHFTEDSISHLNISDIGSNSHAAIDTHIGSAAIHYTEASIDHTAIQNIGSNTHNEIDTHIASSAIHFTEASIDHTAISNIGSNSHAAIDTHIGSSSIHFTEGEISIPASQVSDFDTEVANNTTVAALVSTTATLVSASHTQNTDTALGSGAVAADHGAASTDMIINVCYGTSATPPTANTTTIGTLYIQYTE